MPAIAVLVVLGLVVADSEAGAVIVLFLAAVVAVAWLGEKSIGRNP